MTTPAINCITGLCNRLDVIFSYHALHGDTRFHWVVNDQCNGEFTEALKVPPWLTFTNHHDPTDRKTSWEVFGDWWRRGWFKYPGLYPADRVRERLQNNLSLLGEGFIAVHYRSTDLLKCVKGQATSVTNLFKFINTCPAEARIWVATDCKESMDLFIKQYGDRVHGNTTFGQGHRKTSLEDAAVDLYMCMLARWWAGSFKSSFSGLIENHRHYLTPTERRDLMSEHPESLASTGLAQRSKESLLLNFTDAKVVLLNAIHYQRRRQRFMESFQANAGFLNDLAFQHFAATPHADVVTPSHFKDYGRKHWWAASRDHVKILEEAIIEGRNHLFVFEDDCQFLPDFEEKFWEAYSNLPRDWHAMRLIWRDVGELKPSPFPALNQCQPSGLMMATLWNRAGIQVAYDYFQKHTNKVIDMVFKDLREAAPDLHFQPATELMIIQPEAKQRGHE